MNKLYIMELDRLGYTLRVVSASPATCRSALIKEYKRAHKDMWGVEPSKEDMRAVRDDLDYEDEITLDKVEWR